MRRRLTIEIIISAIAITFSGAEAITAALALVWFTSGEKEP